jgi:prophage maintenance system killer protein
VQFANSQIKIEFERWSAIATNGDTRGSQVGIGIQDVLAAHFLIVDFFMETARGIGGVGPRDINLLHSAVSRQFVSLGMREKWPAPLQKCATLLFGLVKDHPFHDANKRTAFLVTLLFLGRLGRTPTVSHKDFEDFIVDVADNKLGKYARFRQLSLGDDAEVIFVHDFLKRNTREIDKRPYTVTYSELNQILKDHGFELINPSGNFIDLIRVEYSRGLFRFRSQPKRKETRLAQVGFPGWKRQVGRGALKTVREKAGLTPEHGCDSQVFFRGADSLTALISEYEAPLRRLASR